MRSDLIFATTSTLQAAALAGFWIRAAWETVDLETLPIGVAAAGSLAAATLGLALIMIHSRRPDTRLYVGAIAAEAVPLIGPAHALVDGMPPLLPGLALAFSLLMLAAVATHREGL